MKTKIKLILLIVAMAGTTEGMAQTTIGADIAPVEGAILDLKQQDATSANVTANKGVVMPRVSLTAKNSLSPLVSGSPSTAVRNAHVGTVVYNINPVAATSSAAGLTVGLYIWDGAKWMLVSNEQGLSFFYVPPFTIEMTSTNQTVDLYQEYNKRFTAAGNTSFHISSGSAISSDVLYSRYDLYYVVLDHSVDVDVSTITNTGATAGTMTYKTSGTTATGGSYINIICVIKE